MSLGNNIRKIRELKDIKREYVAAKLALSISAYGKIERGITNITANQERKQAIATILGVSNETLEHFDEQVDLLHIDSKKGRALEERSGDVDEIESDYELMVSLQKQALMLFEKVTIALLMRSGKGNGSKI